MSENRIESKFTSWKSSLFVVFWRCEWWCFAPSCSFGICRTVKWTRGIMNSRLKIKCPSVCVCEWNRTLFTGKFYTARVCVCLLKRTISNVGECIKWAARGYYRWEKITPRENPTEKYLFALGSGKRPWQTSHISLVYWNYLWKDESENIYVLPKIVPHAARMSALSRKRIWWKECAKSAEERRATDGIVEWQLKLPTPLSNRILSAALNIE